MQLRSVALFARLAIVLALAPVATACSDDDDDGTGPTSPLIGSWDVTSFTALGNDFIADGMTLSADIHEAGTYTFTVTGDAVDFCDGGASDCTQSGSWTGTSSTITIDPGVDEVTFNWTISGNTMTWTGAIDNIPATVVLVRD